VGRAEGDRYAGTGAHVDSLVTRCETEPALRDNEDLVMFAMNVLRRARRAGWDVHFDESNAVVGMGTVFDDSAMDGPATRLFAVVGGHDNYAYSLSS
jgi:hypothetical protein